MITEATGAYLLGHPQREMGFCLLPDRLSRAPLAGFLS